MEVNMNCCGYFKSDIGLVEIESTDSAVISLNFVKQRHHGTKSNPITEEAVKQISEYFAGKRSVFELPILLYGTDFQKKVWQQLLKVPFGSTASYQDIAQGVGNPLAVRAVGLANGRNPISIIVPCHRIIGKNGRLVGYGGGLWRKEWLLRHEAGIKNNHS